MTRHWLKCGSTLGVLLALGAGGAGAQAPMAAALTADTARTAAAAAAPAPAASAAVATVIAGADGFGLRSEDGSFNLRIRGGVQYDGRFFVADEAGAATDQFQVRRVRSDIQGTLHRDYEFRVNLDYSGSRVDLLDAYINAGFTPALQLRAGKMKGPVGLERLQTPFAMSFAERALPTSLVPNRDIGVQLHGTFAGGAAEYALGLFNGVSDGGSADADDADSKDINARVFVRPFRLAGVKALEGLGLGVSGTHGRQSGAAAAPGVASFRTGGRELFFRYRADGTLPGTVVLDGTRTRISPQGTWYHGNIGAMGEYVRVTHRVRRGDEARDLTNSSWQVTGSYVLTGEATSFRGVTPRRPFDARKGDWGAWEVVARANALEVDPTGFPVFADPSRGAQSATGYGVGVNWYVNRAVRLLLNYERTGFGAAPGGGERAAEQVLVSRMQLAF
jgi:phosphate-selective porin OprO and OprP